jgi:ABC-type branched-subunit amino acid transport system ATPase component/ABC-type branched-subunit amino acid transport system permease subunit
MFEGWFTRQLLFDGLVNGMVFGLVAMGIVLVYRSTRVINFAVANLGIIGAGLFALLVAQYSVPFWIAAAISMIVGVLYGAIIELAVIRRLFNAPRVIVLVATIGIAQLSLAVLIAYPEIDAPGARFPVPFGSVHEWAGVRVVGPQLAILLVVPLVALGLGWLLNRTALGKAVKASAENPDLARLSGISPKAVSTAVWALAGGLATLSLALLAGQSGSAQNLDNLGPSTLVRALAAAVLAGMFSFPRAFLAGILIGIVQAVISFNFLDQPGLMDFLVFIAIVIAVWWQSRAGRGETQTFAFGAKAKPIPERLRQVWWLRQIDRIGLLLLFAGAVVLPLIVTQPSRHLLYTSILAFGICALSLTVLTGWAGQLSLGQMAFAGVGALLTAAFTRGINVDIGWRDTRFIHAGIEALRFGPSVVFAVLITAAIAALIGVGALRVRGLYLAVVTFAFALAASQYLYDRPILSGGFTDSVPLRRTDVFGIDVTSQRSFYYVTLAVLAVTVVIVSRLRASGVGRTTIGVRDNPDTASAYTVSNTRTKLRTFALAGGLAALGGALLAANIQAVPSDRYFTVADSLLVVSMVVIGGLGSVTGAVLGAVWVIGLPSFFPGNDLVPLLTSSIGLLVLLLYFPGGLMQIGYGIRRVILEWAEGRLGPAPAKKLHAVPARKAETREPVPEGVPVLQAEDVVVRFGGNVAVDNVSIEVGDGEVVGLIGTNGAGKSTLMNAIGGYVPSSGAVELEGTSVTGKSPAARARMGLGRSFQAATLFPELTVRDTVLVALEGRGHTKMLSTAVFWPGAIRKERAKRSEAEELIDFLGLGRYADTYIGDLSTGTRRIVELAGLLALDSRMLCLDEPTAGVAQRETEAFGPLILELRRELGASMLVIEHDMPLIMSISDRVYCLESGRVIAEGLPAELRQHPAVIASYLGTDERAIARSGAVAEAVEHGAIPQPPAVEPTG